MLTPDYQTYLDTQQAVNLALFRHLRDAEITLA
jgi:hypothetical protein